MANSETILGRADSRRAWEVRERHNNKLTRNRWGFRVSVYRTRNGKLFYTGPIPEDLRDARPGVLYRVRVYPKGVYYGCY